MRINGVEIDDTYSEAFDMVASRVLITAKNEEWAHKTAVEATGFGTSVIECGAEAGIETTVDPSETPDGRPGIMVIFTAMSTDGLEDQMRKRIGQCIMTSPSTACFNALDGDTKISTGGNLRFFGDSYQIAKRVSGDFSKNSRRIWRVPTMEDEFPIEEEFGIKEDAVGGGNFFILGKDKDSTLEAAEESVEAIKSVKGTITPFPGGVVASGSKPTSKYPFLDASTNTARCPTLKSIVDTKVPQNVNSVLEIVINGLDENSISNAIEKGIKRASTIDGIEMISAGNYGGKIGDHLFHLNDILEEMS